MDAERFDDWTKALTTNTGSRRQTLRLLAGGTLGALLGLRQRGETGAEHGCRHAGRPCSRDGQCCSGDCLGNNTCRCARASQCPQPTDPCKKAVCTAKGKCTFGNKANDLP